MSNNTTNTAQEVNNVLSKDFIKRTAYAAVFEKYATMSENIPSKKGDTIKWLKWNRMTPKTDAVATEGVTPAATTVTKSDVTASVAQYIDWVEHTDELKITADSKPLQNINKLLSEEVVEIKDILCMNALYSGAGVLKTATSMTSAANILTALDALIITFRTNRVPVIKSVIDGSPKYGSAAIPAAYVIFCDATTEATMRDITGFIPVEKYGSTKGLLMNEIGALVEGFRIVRSDHSMQTLDDGAPALIVIGDNAFGVTKITEGNSGIIVKDLGYGDDPADQRGSQAFKMLYVAKVINSGHVATITTT